VGYLEVECVGCTGSNKKSLDVQNKSLIGCTMLPKSKGVMCPCLRCLIKVMCMNDCLKLKDYEMDESNENYE
jgi:hypothetical protein